MVVYKMSLFAILKLFNFIISSLSMKRIEFSMKLFADTKELFPVASSTTFFTDLHYILKVMSNGNVRSACNHRLRFLEEVIFSKIIYGLFVSANGICL